MPDINIPLRRCKFSRQASIMLNLESIPWRRATVYGSADLSTVELVVQYGELNVQLRHRTFSRQERTMFHLVMCNQAILKKCSADRDTITKVRAEFSKIARSMSSLDNLASQVKQVKCSAKSPYNSAEQRTPCSANLTQCHKCDLSI